MWWSQNVYGNCDPRRFKAQRTRLLVQSPWLKGYSRACGITVTLYILFLPNIYTCTQTSIGSFVYSSRSKPVMLLLPPNLRGHNDNYACSVSWGPQPQLPKKHTVYLTSDEHVHCYNCTSWCVKDQTDAYHPQCTERWKLGFLRDLL